MDIYFYSVKVRVNYEKYPHNFDGYTIANDEAEAIRKVKNEYGSGVEGVYVERKDVVERAQ